MANVSAFMTPNPAACDVTTPLREVARMMADHDCGEIPVLDARGAPLGVITDRDIAVRVVAAGRDGSATAGDAMTMPAQCVGLDADLRDCVELMERARIRRVPVVDADGRLAGIVSLADIALAGKSRAIAEVVREVSAPPG
ncbi:CBS domain-containing protein [Lysobacter sp. cf310]|uniref:CBS domain-containing protein n=1 Tax=Lysobacter sp. cf310 TaxID=1761790 RepID=UPI0008EE6707|nr:CBS domain-containing protein [Lysobacter sp. cf310]SFK96174.1 CBS domain-containing protein [Lysobacter sp. cf310]